MPAHTSAADVGRVRLSDGQLLSAVDRTANELADELAKRGAEAHRLPEATRRKAWEFDQLAVWAARRLGVATQAANNHSVPGAPGTQRDSVGVPRWRRQAQ